MNPYSGNSVVLEHLGKTLVVCVKGEWDFCVAGELGRLFDGVEANGDVVVDLRGASFFDSSALSQLMTFHKRVRFGGFSLETLSIGSIRRILQLTSLDRMLEMSPERAASFDARRRSSERARAAVSA